MVSEGSKIAFKKAFRQWLLEVFLASYIRTGSRKGRVSFWGSFVNCLLIGLELLTPCVLCHLPPCFCRACPAFSLSSLSNCFHFQLFYLQCSSVDIRLYIRGFAVLLNQPLLYKETDRCKERHGGSRNGALGKGRRVGMPCERPVRPHMLCV